MFPRLWRLQPRRLALHASQPKSVESFGGSPSPLPWCDAWVHLSPASGRPVLIILAVTCASTHPVSLLSSPISEFSPFLTPALLRPQHLLHLFSFQVFRETLPIIHGALQPDQWVIRHLSRNFALQSALEWFSFSPDLACVSQ